MQSNLAVVAVILSQNGSDSPGLARAGGQHVARVRPGQLAQARDMTYFGPPRTANHGRYMFLPVPVSFTGKSILIHSTNFYYSMSSPCSMACIPMTARRHACDLSRLMTTANTPTDHFGHDGGSRDRGRGLLEQCRGQLGSHSWPDGPCRHRECAAPS